MVGDCLYYSGSAFLRTRRPLLIRSSEWKMIHANISRLNTHMYSKYFQGIMEEINNNQEAGTTTFELDVLYLSKEEKLDLIAAFDTMGYDVEFNEDEEEFTVEAR